MAYMNQERKAKIKAALDKVLKPAKFKYSLRCTNSSITLTLMKGPIDFAADFNRTLKTRPYRSVNEVKHNYMSINPYWFQDHFSPSVVELLKKVNAAMLAADYYDNSDAMTDYFDTAYYYNIEVGRYSKEYEVIK